MVKKVNYYVIQMAKDAIREILTEKLPVKVALQCIRNTDRIEKEMNIFLALNRQIADKYRDPETKKIIEEKKPEYEKEMDEVFQTEVEVDLNPVDFKLIENIPGISFKPATLKILSDLGLLSGVEEPEPEVVPVIEPVKTESK
jgi:hypothetical protein